MLQSFPMDLQQKLQILADAAKYHASCASSGAKRKAAKGGLGNATGIGICHSYTPDGRCVSLLKILLTNFCIYDCAYCVNRVSSNVPRARFTTQEVVGLTLDFYRRNYIEGLFLSSGIIRNADYTMEQLVLVARTLREEHEFRGYIHLKTIPEASAELIEAMAAGCACIGSRVPAVEELIYHERTGWLVEHESPASLADAITTALGGDAAWTDSPAGACAATYDL